MRKWLGVLLATIILCALSVCEEEETGGHGKKGVIEKEQPFTGLTSLDEVADCLFWTNDGSSLDNPVELSVKISADEWDQLFNLIKLEDKFFTLDISHCYDVPQEFVREFRNNEKIVSIALPVGITSTRSSIFYSCTNLKQVILPEGITLIGSSTFNGCTSLEQITLPASLTRIGDDAFRNCTSLTRVTCRATTPPTLKIQVFYNTSANLSIQVPPASVAAYKADAPTRESEGWKQHADKIVGF